MFNSKSYKTNALALLKGRWILPCFFSVTAIAVYCCVSTATTMSDSIILLALALCIYGIVLVGLLHVSIKLQNRSEVITAETFFEGFEIWIKAVLGTLWFMLWVMLWGLLFIIPGMIKAISYSMMFCVIAENPEIGTDKAMKISKILTDGHKANLFGFVMGFFGWFLLSCISMGIGFIWLIPYFQTAFVNAYFDLKRMAFLKGTLTPADFCN